MQFCFPGGATDSELCASAETDDYGRVKIGMSESSPIALRPSAWWYMDQVEVNNSMRESYHVLEQRVFHRGSDLLIQMRIDGLFSQACDLADFPVDELTLGIRVVVCCREQGPVPVQLVLHPALVGVVLPQGFELRQQWKLKMDTDRPSPTDGTSCVGELKCELYKHGRPGRYFPAVEATMRLKRRPFHYVYNCCVPNACFSGLAMMQFYISPFDVVDRLSVTLTLLLTAYAHKITIAQIIPAIPYMTALDSYTVWNSGMLILLTLAGGIDPGLAWLITFIDEAYSSPVHVRREHERGLRPRSQVGRNENNQEERAGYEEHNESFDALVLRVDTWSFYVLFTVWLLVQLNAIRWLVGKQRESVPWLNGPCCACSPLNWILGVLKLKPAAQAAPSNERLPDTAWMF